MWLFWVGIALACRQKSTWCLQLVETGLPGLGTALVARTVESTLVALAVAEADITKPVARAAVVAFPGLGAFVPPQNTYAAVWAYPRTVMRAFVKSADWLPTLHTTRAMREKAAWGWRHSRILTLADDPSLRIYHLGKSGPYLVRVRGHNTLPAAKMLV